MKKFNLFAMSMLAIAAFTFNSCSTDDTMSPTTGQETVDGFYNMTIQVKGSAGDATRTIQSNPENGTVEESAITSGTIYIYQGTERIFKKNVTANDWKTAPTQTTVSETKPIKVSVNYVKENTPYTVYFLANADLDYPLAANAAFAGSTVGGANYAGNNHFVMFNQNDKNKHCQQDEKNNIVAAKGSGCCGQVNTVKVFVPAECKNCHRHKRRHLPGKADDEVGSYAD